MQQLSPLFDLAVELAATALAELVGRARMKELTVFLEDGERVLLILGRQLAVVDLLLSLAQNLRVLLQALGQLLLVQLVLARHLLRVLFELVALRLELFDDVGPAGGQVALHLLRVLELLEATHRVQASLRFRSAF